MDLGLKDKTALVLGGGGGRVGGRPGRHHLCVEARGAGDYLGDLGVMEGADVHYAATAWNA